MARRGIARGGSVVLWVCVCVYEYLYLCVYVHVMRIYHICTHVQNMCVRGCMYTQEYTHACNIYQVYMRTSSRLLFFFISLCMYQSLRSDYMYTSSCESPPSSSFSSCASSEPPMYVCVSLCVFACACASQYLI